MNSSMASAISTPTYLCSSSTSGRSPTLCALSTQTNSHPKTHKICSSKWVPQLGMSSFLPWNGLKHLGISISLKPLRRERKRLCKGRVVYASLFGVGAPEALVIGVVALLVFGPKGLAEVARNLGKTLRAFQPTIREIQEVSREFKSTLEREIGLDEIQRPTQSTYRSNTTTPTSTPSSISPGESQMEVDPNGAPSPNRAYSSEDYLKITEEQLKAAATQQQTQTSPPGETLLESQTEPQDVVQETVPSIPQQQQPGSKT